MFRPDDLSDVEWRALLRTLRTSHDYGVYATMHKLVDDSPYSKVQPLIDGQIEGDESGRKLSATFLDPDRKMHDVEGILCGRFVIQIYQSVPVPELDKIIEFPIFTGPLDSCARSDNVISITARGKGALHQKEPGHTVTIKKGVKKTEGLKRLAEQAGEHRSAMEVPDRQGTFGSDFVMSSHPSKNGDMPETWWDGQLRIADSLNLMLYYRQNGHYKARLRPHAPAFRFIYGDDGFLTSMPNVTVDNKDFHNEVWVQWSINDDTPLKKWAKAVAPPAHPFSAQTLRWRQSLRREILYSDRQGVNSAKDALEIAHNTLDRELLHTVNVTAECYPFPFIEPGDLYRFVSRDYTDSTRIESWTYPLAPGSAMTLGWTDVRSRGVAR